MKVLVAGGTGALGRRVVRGLVEAGHTVAASARSTAGAQAIRDAGAGAIELDVYDASAVRVAVAGHDAVLRLTTKIPPLRRMRSAAAWKETGRLRTQAARIMVDACIDAGVGAYVHESVVFVYADGADVWLDEDAPIDARPTPLRDAMNGEVNAVRFTAAGGRGVVLRFAGFYAADSAQTLAMAAMARRRRFALVGPSQNRFASIHLDDAAAATVAALTVPAGTYNIVDRDPLPLAEVLGSLAEAAGAPPLRHLPAWTGPLVLGEVWSYLRRSQRVSGERFRAATGWEPRFADARAGYAAIAASWAGDGVTVSQGSPP